MMNRRRALIEASQRKAELYFVKEQGKYIDTGISARVNSDYKRLIILDFVPTYYSSTSMSAVFYGVCNPTNSSRNRFIVYRANNDYVSVIQHTGNSNSQTFTSSVVADLNNRHKIIFKARTNSTTNFSDLIVDDGVTPCLKPSQFNTYTQNLTLALGALHGSSYGNSAWAGNIYEFSIYNSDTEDSSKLVFQLVPREDNGVIRPYETVSQQFMNWSSV